MRNTRFNLLLSALLLCVFAISASYPKGYYDSLNGKNKASLKTAAKDVVYNHTIIDYGTATWNAFKTTDCRTIDGVDYWYDMYSSTLRKISDGNGGLNIEHSVANSWWDGTKNAAYKDLHHLNPADAIANNRKSNFPLGIVSTETYSNGVTIVGKPANSADFGGASYVYEPCDEYKGDFARVFFYMFTTYEDMTWGTRFTWMYTEGEKYPMLKPWAYNLLLEWSRQDPVSEKEIARNDAVYSVQGNRNPFIDFPDLAEYIWGDSKDDLFYVEGDHSGDATKEPELRSPINGEVLNFGSVQQGKTSTMNLYVKGLYLTKDITLAIEGENFTLGSTTVTAAQANEGYNVAVTFNAVEEGDTTASITLASDEFEPCVVVCSAATIVPVSQYPAVVALDPTDITTTSYTANWEAPEIDGDKTPDTYIVMRTRYENGELKTRQYMTNQTYYNFTDRDANYDESYSVKYMLGGVLSAISNTITIHAGETGVATITDVPLWIESGVGSLHILAAPNGAMFEVYDVAGRRQAVVVNPAAGDVITLNPGIYILRGGDNAVPQKVIVR
jgi:endonuclease I